jgi:hypothetical protein
MEELAHQLKAVTIEIPGAFDEHNAAEISTIRNINDIYSR